MKLSQNAGIPSIPRIPRESSLCRKIVSAYISVFYRFFYLELNFQPLGMNLKGQTMKEVNVEVKTMPNKSPNEACPRRHSEVKNGTYRDT